MQLKIFILSGLIGFITEVIFTGMISLIKKDLKLTAITYLWMFPIYGIAGLGLYNISLFFSFTWWMYIVVMIYGFTIEYISGYLLTNFIGFCPWDYTGSKWSIHGLIRLDYAPFWLLLGVIYIEVLLPIIITLNL